MDTQPSDPKVAHRIRLRVRLAKSLTTDELSRTIEFEGRSVEVASQIRDQALSKTTWVVFSAGEFKSEAEAYEFGRRLRRALIAAGLASRLGVDAGFDKPTSYMNEDFARSLGWIAPHERIAPNVHGLMVIPDDKNTRFPVFSIEATVSAAPDHVLGAIASLGSAPTLSAVVNEALVIVNMAMMNAQPIAQLALALSAVEALGQTEKWTDEQHALIEELVAHVEGAVRYVQQEREEVATALRRNLHKIGLRQGVMRILSKLGLAHLKKEWDRIYNARSGLFHGTYRPDEQEISQLANDAITLCGTIVLTLAKYEGLKLPEIATTHFPSLSDRCA